MNSMSGYIRGACALATLSMPSLMSAPETRPVGPTRAAAARATKPVPQATSRTVAPGERSAASRIAATKGAMIGAAYCS